MYYGAMVFTMLHFPHSSELLVSYRSRARSFNTKSRVNAVAFSGCSSLERYSIKTTSGPPAAPGAWRRHPEASQGAISEPAEPSGSIERSSHLILLDILCQKSNYREDRVLCLVSECQPAPASMSDSGRVKRRQDMHSISPL